MSNTVDIKEMKELTNPSAAPEERIYQTFYPKTHVKGVVVDENNRLDEVLDSIVEDAETAATEAATVVKDQCEEIRTDMNNQLLASDLTFDISKNNLTSGQPTEYADLTAALGSGGGNIPEDYRKGGMTVKFIENTNHTYLQYRLMNKNFSTVVSDWQGVDEEILSGSKNLITSDGVVKALSKLPINYISEKSLTNFTTELASKLGTFLNASINISASYNQTSQEYNYTITITQN